MKYNCYCEPYDNPAGGWFVELETDDINFSMEQYKRNREPMRMVVVHFE